MNPSFRFIQPCILAAAGVLAVLSPAVSPGQDNTAFGTGALQSGTKTGVEDSAFGFDALHLTTTGTANTATGMNALSSNTTGGYNTADGQGALGANSLGFFNTATGSLALRLNTTGTGNTANGAYALYNCTIDSEETALGYGALYSDKVGFGGLPNQNVALGYQALYSSTDGFENLAAGYQALYHSAQGDDNTALGYEALNEVTTGGNNIGVGHSAGIKITTGSNNIDIGSPGAMGDTRIIRIGDGTQTAIYLTGVIHGNGSGLNGVSVPASAVTGAIQGSQLAAGSVSSAKLANNLTLGGTTTGIFSGAVSGNGSGLTNIPATAVAAAPTGMVLIPAGSFTMGNSIAADTDITDAAPVSVTVSTYYIDANLVSLGQWHSVYYWATSNGYAFDSAGAGDGARNPVYNVDWYDCVKWCNARSQQAGLTPVYYTDAGFTSVFQTPAQESGTVYMNMAAAGYRLPTEAEWEKAARGGLSGQRFPWGNTIDETLANYHGDTTDYGYDLGPNGYNALDTLGSTAGSTTPVGSFPANAYGLFDMAGNLFEWCWDWYGTPYSGGSNPSGPATGTYRVFRGGGWITDANYVRCAFRDYNSPTEAIDFVGFRSVLSPGQP